MLFAARLYLHFLPSCVLPVFGGITTATNNNTSHGRIAAAVCDFDSIRYNFNQGTLAFEFLPAVSAAHSASKHTNTHKV